MAGTLTVAVHGESFLVERSDSPDTRLFWDTVAGWEPDTFDVLERFLNPGGQYLDVGAWVGPTVLYASRLVGPSGRVWAVEPDLTARTALIHNLEFNAVTNVTVLDCAVSDRAGDALFGTRTVWGDSQSSLLWSEQPQRVSVPTVTLQGLCEAEGCHPALVKLDVEGGEAVILPRAAPWLAEQRIPLWLSVHCDWLDAGAHAALIAAVRSLGGTCPAGFATALVNA